MKKLCHSHVVVGVVLVFSLLFTALTPAVLAEPSTSQSVSAAASTSVLPTVEEEKQRPTEEEALKDLATYLFLVSPEYKKAGFPYSQLESLVGVVLPLLEPLLPTVWGILEGLLYFLSNMLDAAEPVTSGLSTVYGEVESALPPTSLPVVAMDRLIFFITAVLDNPEGLTHTLDRVIGEFLIQPYAMVNFIDGLIPLTLLNPANWPNEPYCIYIAEDFDSSDLVGSMGTSIYKVGKIMENFVYSITGLLLMLI